MLASVSLVSCAALTIAGDAQSITEQKDALEARAEALVPSQGVVCVSSMVL